MSKVKISSIKLALIRFILSLNEILVEPCSNLKRRGKKYSTVAKIRAPPEIGFQEQFLRRVPP